MAAEVVSVTRTHSHEHGPAVVVTVAVPTAEVGRRTARQVVALGERAAGEACPGETVLVVQATNTVGQDAEGRPAVIHVALYRVGHPADRLYRPSPGRPA